MRPGTAGARPVGCAHSGCSQPWATWHAWGLQWTQACCLGEGTCSPFWDLPDPEPLGHVAGCRPHVAPQLEAAGGPPERGDTLSLVCCRAVGCVRASHIITGLLGPSDAACVPNRAPESRYVGFGNTAQPQKRDDDFLNSAMSSLYSVRTRPWASLGSCRVRSACTHPTPGAHPFPRYRPLRARVPPAIQLLW